MSKLNLILLKKTYCYMIELKISSQILLSFMLEQYPL